MDPTWLIEADVPGIDSARLQAEVRRQGMIPQVVKWRAEAPAPRDLLGSESIPLDASVVVLATLPVMRHVQAQRRWLPGGWCSFDRLRCSTYYAFFGPFLLNSSYTLLPGVEAIRQADRLFDVHGRDGRVFVRPDAVWKTFRGGPVSRAAFESTLAPTRFDPTSLVLVSEVRNVEREWRLVVAQGAVVGASQYFVRGDLNTAPGCPAEVRSFAERVLARVAWRPDPLFILDVCESDGDLRVVELNGFSCSGLYDCEVGPVVAAASESARFVAGSAAVK